MNAASPLPPRVLVIDDAPQVQADFCKILRAAAPPNAALLAAQTGLFGSTPPPPAADFEVDCAAQGRDGLVCVERALAEGRPYAVAFVDMRMPPGWDGLETIRHLWAADPALQVVICTAYSDHSWSEMVEQVGQSDSLLILKKPFDNIEVLQLAHALARKWEIARRDRHRLADLDEMVRQRTAELRSSEERFAKMFHANPLPVALQSLPDGRYLDANAAFLALVGAPRDAVLQRTPAELALWPGADVWTDALQSLEKNSPLRGHRTRLRTRAGLIRDVVLSVEQLLLGPQRCVLSTVEDITERVQLEEKFRQAQKMEAVGQLAAGVAHNFNNILTVIQAYASIMLDQPHRVASEREGLEQIHAAVNRAAALTRQLVAFSRQDTGKPEPIDAAGLLTRLRAMLRCLVPEHIRLDWHCAEDLPWIHADRVSLEQVVMNLVVNARDAMPRGGVITFDLRAVTFDEAAAARHPGARVGRFVRLTISDTGCGMEPTVLAHVFEPFFTTKGVGRGTGLGLSTAYAIIRQHAGWIETDSTPGVGTRFEIFLPALAERPAPNGATAVKPFAPDALRGRGERILLVEDEEDVRSALRAIASRAGYDVTEASDGPSALKTWAGTAQPFDLLLTDMMMPNHCNGSELATQLRARHPPLKVIITTGHSRELLDQRAPPPAGVRLLHKPYDTETLLRAIRDTLDAPSPG